MSELTMGNPNFLSDIRNIIINARSNVLLYERLLVSKGK